MKLGILGDIHSNRQALEATLAHLEACGAQSYFSVGDVVGYGADPEWCIARLRELGAVVVSGNHDQAVVGELDHAYFNQPARIAVAWTRQNLSADALCWLAERPLTVSSEWDVTVAHATIHRPEAFEYIHSYADAARSLNTQTTSVAFIGHSHVPAAFMMRDTLEFSEAERLDLSTCTKALVNVGSIGQPRDENPHAACALFDTESRLYELHRVPYDIESAAYAIEQAGLPSLLGERLGVGR